MLSTADRLVYTALNLTTFTNGTPKGSGTGFYWVTEYDDSQAICVITNKHVLAGVDALTFHCHTQSATDPTMPSGAVVDVKFTTDPILVFNHPDPDVDLCALVISSITGIAAENGHRLYIEPLSADIVPKDEDWNDFDSIEDILMIGCPRGIYDQINYLPISRRGITASPLSKLYNGANEFLVDIACFPGSSGSPVFVYNRDGYLDRKANTYRMGQQRLYLVGILYAGPLITNQGQIVLHQQPRVEVAAMMHLGQVIRSSALLTIDKMLCDKLKEEAASRNSSGS